MMTSKNNYFPLLIAGLIVFIPLLWGCDHRRETLSPYGWVPVDDEFDSITLVLERRFLHYRDFDSSKMDVESLGQMAKAAPEGKKTVEQVRYLYWLGRYMKELGHSDSSLSILKKAAELVDSVRYPYDAKRIRRSMGVNPDVVGSAAWYDQIKSDIEFYESVGDCMMAGDRYMDLATTLSDMGYDQNETLSMIDKADSLFTVADMPQHVLENNINRAYILEHTDPEKATSILWSLLEDSVMKANPKVLHIIYNNIYGYSLDTVALRKGYENLADLPTPSPGLECYYESLLAQNIARAGDIKLAERYMYDAFDKIDYLKGMGSLVPVYNAMADVARRGGDYEVADLLMLNAFNLQDSLNRQNAVSHALQTEFNNHLAELERTAERERHRRDTVALIAAFLVAAGVGVAGWIVYRRIQRQELAGVKARLKSEQSERKVLAMMLAMEEKDNMVATLGRELDTLVEEGEVSATATQRIRNAVKLHAGSQEERDNFIETFAQIHPSFTKSLKTDFPSLSDTELKLAALITMGLESKHIARLLAIRPDSVKQARWRLRSKMNLATADSLSDFLARYK